MTRRVISTATLALGGAAIILVAGGVFLLATLVRGLVPSLRGLPS